MMRLDKDENVPRKTCVVFFVIDTSDSMSGARIGAVNSAIEETLIKFREMNMDDADAEIEVAILAFSSGARWITPNCPVKPENYRIDLDAGGKRDMGEAFMMLEASLNKNSGFMQEASKSYAPVIILMTDGEPTDDYKTHLTKLQNNGWFKVSVKVALAVGDEANDQILMEFTGSKEAVVRIPDGRNAGEKLSKMIQFIAVADEKVCTSYGYDENTKLNQEQLDLNEVISSDDWDDWGDDSWSDSPQDNISNQTKNRIKTGQIELFVQPSELDKINSAKKIACWLVMKDSL